MRKYKRPCELKTKVIRINLEDYWLLDELCRTHYVTMAQALHLLLKQVELPHLFVKPSPSLTVKPVLSVAAKPSQAVLVKSRVAVNQNGGVR